MFKLEIQCGNAAFADGDAPYEISRILERVARTIRSGGSALAPDARGTFTDINGNSVGAWSLSAQEEEGARTLPPEDSGTAPGRIAEAAARLRYAVESHGSFSAEQEEDISALLALVPEERNPLPPEWEGHEEALDWITGNAMAIRRDNGDMDYSLGAMIAAYEAGKVATEERETESLLSGDERALAALVLERFALGSGPFTEADARWTARIIRQGLEPVAPLDEVLKACRVLPKGPPQGEASAGEPGDEWQIIPMLRSYDMDEPSGLTARPSGLALMLIRDKLALPMELSALALAEIARGEWNELIRQARHMVEAFKEADEEAGPTYD